jgi:HSP20 family protein
MRFLTKTLEHHTSDPLANLIDGFFSDSLPELFQSDLLPATNIAETDKTYVVSMEMPGLQEQDIQVEVKDRVLTIRAERKDETKDEGRHWHRIEQRYGQFARTIRLPQDARSEGIEGVYQQGVLTLTVHKEPQAQPTRIPIKGQ